MKFLLALLIFIPTLLEAGTAPVIRAALAASVKVVIPSQATGSGFAFFRDKARGKTLIATNNHVCQTTRGLVYLIGTVDYKQRLNTFDIFVETVGQDRFQARVAYTSNAHRATEDDPRDDLCIIEIDQEMPIVELGSDVKLGERVFSVSAPSGYFPVVHDGFAGLEYLNPGSNPVQVFSLYISPGSSGGGIFNKHGKVVGVLFAIIAATEDVTIPIVALGVPVSNLKKFKKQYDARRKKK